MSEVFGDEFADAIKVMSNLETLSRANIPTRYEQAMARIEWLREGNVMHWYNQGAWALKNEEMPKVLDILKSVLELHGTNLSGHCIGCTDVSKAEKGIDAPHIVNFPCPTAEKIIEGVLG